MYAFMDHEDFVKSRKALLSTSFILLVIQIFEISGNNIDVFGLNINFNRNASIGLASLFVIYFLFIFVLRALDGRLNDIYKRTAEEEKRRIQEDIDTISNANQEPSTPEAHIRWLEHRLEGAEAMALKKADYMHLLIYVVADILPPVSLAIFALRKVNIDEAIAVLL
jgi:hypothetical protein